MLGLAVLPHDNNILSLNSASCGFLSKFAGFMGLSPYKSTVEINVCLCLQDVLYTIYIHSTFLDNGVVLNIHD